MGKQSPGEKWALANRRRSPRTCETCLWGGGSDRGRAALEFVADVVRLRRARETDAPMTALHEALVAPIPKGGYAYPLSESAATEFVVTSVTSDNLDDIVKVPEGVVSAVAAPLIRAANRHVHWVDTDRHGYGVLDLTAERAQMDYYVLSDRTKASATSKWARSYRTRSGTQKVERTHDPV